MKGVNVKNIKALTGQTNGIDELLGIVLANFRVFENVNIDFKPITILTGPNNSGKSTIIKALLLIDDNIKNENLDEAGFNSIWDFNNENHQLSNPSICIRKEDSPIIIGIKVNNNHDYYMFFLDNKGKQLFDAYILTGGAETILIQKEQDVVIDLEFFKDYLINFIQSEKEYYELERLIPPELIEFNKKVKNRDQFNLTISKNDFLRLEKLHEQVVEKLKLLKINNEETTLIYKFQQNDSNIKDAPEAFEKPFGPDMTNLFFNHFFNTKPFEEETIFKLFPPLRGFKNKRGLNIHYLPSIKGLLERSYSTKDNSVLKNLIEQVLMDNINTPVSSENKENNVFNNESKQIFIEKWLEKFEIGKKLHLSYDENKGIYFINLDGRSLLDYGYGITQLISFFIFLGLQAKPQDDNVDKIIIFEEPEANLHPTFQSKFIEMIVDAQNTFGFRFIIETHSEYLIRKLQYLTAEKKEPTDYDIKPEDSVIYYFHDPNHVPKGEEQVKELHINEDGSLTGDFGPGFFDEATNLKFELLKLKNPQKN